MVFVFKRGSFILYENIFENYVFFFEILILYYDFGYVIDVRFNWWGLINECDIVDRIFDYCCRV